MFRFLTILLISLMISTQINAESTRQDFIMDRFQIWVSGDTAYTLRDVYENDPIRFQYCLNVDDYECDGWTYVDATYNYPANIDPTPEDFAYVNISYGHEFHGEMPRHCEECVPLDFTMMVPADNKYHSHEIDLANREKLVFRVKMRMESLTSASAVVTPPDIFYLILFIVATFIFWMWINLISYSP